VALDVELIANGRLALEGGFIVRHGDFDRLVVVQPQLETGLRQLFQIPTDPDHRLHHM
jgi:hypothetical protein